MTRAHIVIDVLQTVFLLALVWDALETRVLVTQLQRRIHALRHRRSKWT